MKKFFIFMSRTFALRRDPILRETAEKRGKRLSALSLSLLLLLPVFSSCGIITIGGSETLPPVTGEQTAPQTDPATEPVTEDPGFRPAETEDGAAADRANLEALPEADLGGAVFRVVTAKPGFFEPEPLEAEEDALSPVDAAKYRRNLAVAERYQVRLTFFELPEESLPDEVRSASYAGDYLGDLIEIDGDACFADFAAHNVTVNLLSLPHTDYTASCFDQRCVAQCSAGSRVYAVAGDANRDYEGTYCVFWNRDLTGEEDLYALAREGKWTWEKLLSLSAEAELTAAASLPGDDLIAIACSGSNLLRTGTGILPEAFGDRSPIEAAVVLARSLSSLAFRADGTSGESDDPAGPFRQGKAAFYIGEAKELFRMNTPGLNWGILPLPKVTDSQETYPSLQSRRTLFVAIPSMISHDNTGYLLQALNAASGNEQREVFLRDALTEAVSSADDIWMLRRAFGSLFCDFGWMISCEEYHSVAKASKTAFREAAASGRTFSYFYDAAEVTLLYWNPINFPL